VNAPLACADFTFPLLAHDQALRLIAMLGFEGVDLGLFEGRSHLMPSTELGEPVARATELRRRLEDLGLQAADVFLQTSDFTEYAVNHPLAERRAVARDLFLRTLDYAATLGAPHVTILPGVVHPHLPPRESRARAVDELAWRLERAAETGLVFAVECHVGSLAPTPAAAARLVAGVPGLTLTLDYTHFTRRGYDDSAIEPLTAHASHFHVRGARRGRLQVSFTENSIDYAGVLRALARFGYRGYLGVEYVWIDWERCNEVDNLSETVRFRDFLRGEMASVA
jgi:sugar phosphate isomerase/epimerase